MCRINLPFPVFVYSIILMYTFNSGTVHGLVTCNSLRPTKNTGEPANWIHYIHFMSQQRLKICYAKSYDLGQFLKCKLNFIINLDSKQLALSHRTAPYGHIVKYEELPELEQWVIMVNKAFIINITVSKMYTKFSESCRSAYMKVFEGHTSHRELPIETLCGHVMYENIYTQHNKGLVIVKTSPEVSANHSVLEATYEILAINSAVRYNTSCSVPGLHSNINPAIVMLASYRIHMFWYVSNTVQYLRGNNASNDLVFLTHLTIKVWFCISHAQTASISVYPGLLSYYWARWKVPPHTVVHCNMQQVEDVILDFHMYATVLLSYSNTDHITHVNVSFHYMKEVKSIAAASKAVLSTSDLPSGRETLAYGSYSAPSSTLTFTGFLYTGQHTTLKSQMITEFRESMKISRQITIPAGL